MITVDAVLQDVIFGVGTTESIKAAYNVEVNALNECKRQRDTKGYTFHARRMMMFHEV
jgi:hypothetical protein